MDVWQNTSLGDGDMSQKLVQLFVISNGKLKMARDDTRLLVVACSITSKFEDFCCEVLENCCEVDRST